MLTTAFIEWSNALSVITSQSSPIAATASTVAQKLEMGIPCSLREVREHRGMTIEDLANKSDISVQTIRGIERGNPRGTRTNETVAYPLCTALNVDISDIDWPNGGSVTNLGRSANSGYATGPINVQRDNVRLCPNCNLEVRGDGGCIYCE